MKVYDEDLVIARQIVNKFFGEKERKKMKNTLDQLKSRRDIEKTEWAHYMSFYFDITLDLAVAFVEAHSEE